jgi:hypothetical protein
VRTVVALVVVVTGVPWGIGDAMAGLLICRHANETQRE